MPKPAGRQYTPTSWAVDMTSDAHHPTAPPADAAGAVRAMQEALCRARLQPVDIDYVNAHGTGTVHNDRAEAVALERIFGAGQVLVSSTKSLIGHTMGAAGAMEAVATILAMQANLVPPTANLHEPDPTIPFDCIPNTPRPQSATLCHVQFAGLWRTKCQPGLSPSCNHRVTS